MSLRDLVAADCAEPNPLARFVQGFSNDKVGINQDQWVDQRDTPSEAGPSLSAFERLKMMEMQKEREKEDMRNMEREARYNDPLEDDAMQNSYRSAFQRGDGPISGMLKSFGNTREFVGRPDMGLSMHDKAMRDRARHFHQGPEFIEGQRGNLRDNLRPSPEEIEEYDAIWRANMDRRMPPPPPHHMMERNRGNAWANEFQHDRWANEFQQEHSHPRGWAGEYERQRANRIHEMDEYEHYMQETQETKRWIEENSHYGDLRSGADAWANEFNQGAPPATWAEEFNRDAVDDTLEKAWDDATDDQRLEEAWGQAKEFGNQKSLRELTDTITRIDDPKLQASSFMQFMRKINKGQVSFADNQVIEHETDEADSWAGEYQGLERQFMGGDDWAKEFGDFRSTVGGDWARDYESFEGGYVDPAKLREYEFALQPTSNPYSELTDAFEQGVDLFNQGMITESILALEAAVHQNPENSKAWQYLGQAHAENDKDTQAITCLEKAVEVEPTNLEALAALAVSYTNDFNREKALEALETWMKRHPEYSHIPASTPPPPASENDFYMDAWSRHTYVANMYIEAARQHPDDPDPEVQTSLGLLYNLSYEYDKAVDCFKAALTKRPTDYLLWNKLGATLANSNRSEEALGAYYKALEGKPTYVRARANLGISFLALNEYPEAANSFLSALKLHPNAVHLWDNLKMVFRMMGRDDLEEKAHNHNVEEFRDQENF